MVIYPMSANIMTKLKTVRITDELHAELSEVGRYGETMDDIIRKCLNAYEKFVLKK